MKCPFCGHAEQKVPDSRPAREGAAIRRRRECDRCARRFTTYEEPEKPRLTVAKRSGAREDYDREKLSTSLRLACGKRPIPVDAVEDAVIRIERRLFDQYENEVNTAAIGDLVMDELYNLDSIAYIRYASVYRSFDDPKQFAEIVRGLQKDAATSRGRR